MLSGYFVAAEPVQPTLQELCRINVRRVIRSNIYRRHPELSKVRKRPKRPKKKPNHSMSNLNIIPMSMGMMILRQFDQEHNMSDSDDNDVLPRRARNQDRDNSEERNANTDTDEEMVGTNDEGANGKSSDKEEKDIEQGLVQDEKEMKTVDSPVVNGNQKEACGKKNVSDDKDDNVSDYGTDEEGDSIKAIDEVAAANGASKGGSEPERSHVRDLERALASRIDQMKEIIASEIAACSSGSQEKFSPEEIVPPDAPNLSDTDDEDDDDDGIQYGVEEFIKFTSANQSSDSNRKLRYPSNTSVDTSTTSGIGSYNEEHLDAEMCRSDSEKTSPGWSNMDAESGKLCDKLQPMDYASVEDRDKVAEKNDLEEEEEDGEDEEIQDVLPKVTLSQLLQEEVESLPLPAALRSYLLFYRC